MTMPRSFGDSPRSRRTRQSVVQRACLLVGALAIATASAQAQTPPAQTPPATPPAAPAAAPAAGPQQRPQAYQPPANGRKRILIIAQTMGWHHDSISDSLAVLVKLGLDSNLYDAEIRTDSEWITKQRVNPMRKNLIQYDAIVFCSTTGELPMSDEQKADLMSFVKDEGKGFVGIHAALDTFYKWPEYGEMIGGYFDGHPWNTFDAPVIIEDPTFPAVKHFTSKTLVLRDEMYQPKAWSREKVNVIMRLDDTKLDYSKAKNARADRDFAITWSKMHGKGRVFYSSLGHTRESWQDPQVQKMYLEAIRWVLGGSEGSTTSHPKK
jgi:type 1 glutamine amidotransferase